MKRFFILAVLGSAALFLPAMPAQDKKAEKKDPPRAIVVVPLGVPAGTTTKVTIFGLKIDQATEVRFFEPKAVAKIVNKAKMAVSNQQDPNKIGDSRLEVELTLPETMQGELAFIIVGPHGESPLQKLVVNSEPAPIAEKEPNNGFRQAQPVAVGQTIEGAIQSAQDVDVFRIDGREGQELIVEVLAARLGSPLDSILTLHDAAGQILASNDDFEGSADSRLTVKLPRTGTYYLSLVDAHDQGGAQYVYRLLVGAAK